MAERKAVVYELVTGRFDLGNLATALEGTGLQLKHPSQGVAHLSTWDSDWSPSDLEGIQSRISSGADVALRFWYDAMRPLTVHVRRSEATWIIDFDLSLTQPDEREALLDALFDYFYAKLGFGLGFVFDPDGLCSDYNWDSFFLEGRRLSRPDLAAVPQVLLVEPSLTERLAGFELTGVSADIVTVEQVPGFVPAGPPDLLSLWLQRYHLVLERAGFSFELKTHQGGSVSLDLENDSVVGRVGHWPTSRFTFRFDCSDTGQILVFEECEFTTLDALNVYFQNLCCNQLSKGRVNPPQAGVA